jgi:hypothetical protein
MIRNDDLIRRSDAIHALKHYVLAGKAIAPSAAMSFSAAAQIISAIPAVELADAVLKEASE